MAKVIKSVRCVDASQEYGNSAQQYGLIEGEVYDVIAVVSGCYRLANTPLGSQFAVERFVDADAPAETYTRFGQEQAARSDWFTRYLSGDKQARKEAPIARGLHGYFPNACLHIAHVSYVANAQHNPGLPMQWAFDKSTDEADCQIRHALDAAGNPVDDDGLLHLAKKAWRANAELERYLLEKYPQAKPGASVTGLVRK